jgi:Uma2 family endonuclease
VAGIAQYWVIDQDQGRTVTMHQLDGGHYTVRATMPLAWVLNTTPADHDLA